MKKKNINEHIYLYSAEIVSDWLFGWREAIGRVETSDREHQWAGVKSGANLVEILVFERLDQLEKI